MKYYLISFLIILCFDNSKAQTGNLCFSNEPTDYIPYKEEANFFPVRNIRIAFHVINGDNKNETIPDNETGRLFINSLLNRMNFLMSNLEPDSCEYPCGTNMSYELKNQKEAIIDSRIRYVKNIDSSITFTNDSGYYNNLKDKTNLDQIKYIIRTTIHPAIMSQYNDDYKHNIIHIYLIKNNINASGCTNPFIIFNMKNSYENWVNDTNSLYVARTLNHEMAHEIGGFADVGGFHFNSVFFTNPSVGFTSTVGIGKILKTSTSGNSWDSQQITSGEIRSILFTNNGMNGYAATYDGLFRSTNSGNSWFKVNNPDSNTLLTNLKDIYFIDTNNGYMISYSFGRIYKTTNAGQSWNRIFYSNKTIFNSISRINSNSFCVVGGKKQDINPNIIDGAIFIFQNDLSDTQEIIIPGKIIKSVYFIDSTTGFAVGEAGLLLKLYDSNNTWHTLTINIAQATTLNSISFGNHNIGYIVGNYNNTGNIWQADVFKTSNGGISWSRDSLNIGENLHDVYLLDSNNIFIVGDYINFIKSNDGGNSWTNNYQNISNSLPELVNNFSNNYPNDHCTYHNGNKHYNDNILTYYPSKGTAFSAMQLGAMHANTYGCKWTRNRYNNVTTPHHDTIVYKFVRKDWCTYDANENLTIPAGTNVTFNSPRYLSGNLIIQSGATLTVKCTLSLPKLGKIYVEAGGKLIVDGGYITNICGDMWQGIVVLGDKTKSQFGNNQGKVELKNNAIIENARIGIAVGTDANDGSQNGGIVNAYGTGTQYSCTFENCDIAVLIYKYKNISTGFNFCYFDHCHFLADAPLVDTIRYNGFSTSVFVKLENVEGVRFYGNTFENATNLTAFRPVGIQSIDATYSVQRSATANDFDPPCIPTGDSNSFIKLRFGIEILSTIGKKSVKINENTFYDCTMGIKNKLDENTKIYHNIFQYSSNFKMDEIEPGNRAISSHGSGKINIDNNIFNWYIASNQKAYGIYTEVFPNQNQTYSNLYKNSFTNSNGNKSIYANYFIGNQSNIKINCNTFNQTTYDLFIYDHICDQFATLSPLKEAGNIFHAWYSGSMTIVNLDNDSLHYYTTASKAPQRGTYQNVKIDSIGVINNSCPSSRPCDYYDCLCSIDTSTVIIVDGTDDKCKIIFDKIYEADFAIADSLILTMNPSSDSIKIQLLNLVYDIFYDGRNFWHLTSSDSISLVEIMEFNEDEASVYADNILNFYYGICSTDEVPTTLSIYKAVNNVTCNGGNDGSISTAIIGGTAPYTYSWSNADTNMGISGVTAGTYILTVTDSTGYFIRDTTTITQPPTPLDFSITVDSNVNCFGDSLIAIFSPSGYVEPYYYRVNNNYNLTEDTNYFHSGYYSVSLIDSNNCISNNNFNISAPSLLSVIPIVINTSCTGQDDGAIELNVLGGINPFSYSWSNYETTQNIYNLTAGSYQVTVTDQNGCTKNANPTVNNDPFIVEIVTGQNPFDLIAHVNNVFDENYNYSYLWTTYDTTNAIYGVPEGYTYGVTVTKRNNTNCYDYDDIYVELYSRGILGIGNSIDYSLIIYPNPVNDELIVSLTSNTSTKDQYTITIDNIYGMNVLTENIKLNKSGENVKNFNLYDFSTGSYILSLYKNDSLIIRKKIIKM